MQLPSTRRDFIIRNVIGAAALAFPPLAPAAAIAEEGLLGGGRYQEGPDGAVKFVLARVIPRQKSLQQAATAFFPHGLAFAKNAPHLAYAFEKIGPGGALIDVVTMRQLEVIPPVKNRLFYGHGVCSVNGELLYSTETTGEGVGMIGVRETKGLRHIGDFPTYGEHPHDCHLIEKGTILAVSNGGGTKASGRLASVCYIDVKTQRLLERVEMSDERFNAGHISMLGGRNAVLVSAPRRGLGEEYLGAVSIQKSKQRLSAIASPQDVVDNMFGEALSVITVPALDLFIVTHPKPGMVTFWKLSTGKLQRRLDMSKARGLALTSDGKSVWISHGAQAELARVNLSTYSLEFNMAATYISGSHLVSV